MPKEYVRKLKEKVLPVFSRTYNETKECLDYFTVRFKELRLAHGRKRSGRAGKGETRNVFFFCAYGLTAVDSSNSDCRRAYRASETSIDSHETLIVTFLHGQKFRLILSVLRTENALKNYDFKFCCYCIFYRLHIDNVYIIELGLGLGLGLESVRLGLESVGLEVRVRS